MKKLLLFALIATLAVVSCTKDEDEKTYSADVTINGTKTTFTDLIFYSAVNTVTIEGQKEDDDIYIYLAEPSVGNRAFGGSNGVQITIGGKDYSSDSGSFTITESTNSVISGNFTGKFYQQGSSNSITISGNFTAQHKNPFDIDF